MGRRRGKGRDLKRWQKRVPNSPPIAPNSLSNAPGGDKVPRVELDAALDPKLANMGVPIAQGAIGGGSQETQLFERRQESRSDAGMARRAIKHRWETPKPLSEVVIRKALTLAAGLPWTRPDGTVRQEEFTPIQMLGAARLALDVDRSNQSDEHHFDRLDYHERSLAARNGSMSDGVPGVTDLHLHLHADTVIETQHRRAAALEAIAVELAGRDGLIGDGDKSSGRAGNSEPAGLGSDPEVLIP